MNSPEIDKWITKHPEWWAEQAEKQTNKQEITKSQFKKLLKKGLTQQNKQSLLKYITPANISKIYSQSKFAPHHGSTPTDAPKEKTRTRKIEIKRKEKTYTKTISSNWNKKYEISLRVAAQAKTRKEYQEYVTSIMQSTGRSRQAVVKKIQRTRRQSSLNS